MAWSKDNSVAAKLAAAEALAQAQRAELGADYIDEKQPLIDEFIGEQTNLQTQLNDLVLQSGTDIAEVVQARGGFATVNDRFADTTAQLAEKVKKGDIFANVKDFGAKADATTDDTAAINAAIDTLKVTGGTLFFPAGRYLINGQIHLPDNQAATNPAQVSIIFRGSGASHSGRGTAPFGGTILDMRYVGDYGKIVTIGLGYLEMENITFADFGTDDTPFIYCVYTTMHIHDCTFYGTKAGINAAQDAIVMGGTQGVEGPRGYDMGFQGYGTVIRDNYFGRVRRAVYGRVFFNANIISDNTIWNTCGSNLVGGAAIEIDGDPSNTTTQVSTGNVISGNLIEVVNYPYGIRLRETERNTLLANNFYDRTATTIAFHSIDTTAKFNYILAGFHDDDRPFVNSTAVTNNTIVNFHQGQISTFPEKQKFMNEIFLEPTVDAGSPKSIRLKNSAGVEMYYRLLGNNRYSVYYIPSGGAETKIFEVQDYGGGVLALNLQGTDARIDASVGSKMKIRTGAGQELWLGDTSAQNIYVLNGQLGSNKANGTAPLIVTSKTPVNNLTVNRIASGTLIATNDAATTGALLISGAGSPEGNANAYAPVGSIYMRTDGGAGTTMYVKESGTQHTGWVAK